MKKREVCQTTACVVHACSACVNAARALFSENKLTAIELYGFSPIIQSQLLLSGGYFISDTILLASFPANYLMAVDDKKDNPPTGRPFQFVVHHIMCLIPIALVLKNPIAQWFMAMRFLTEVPNIVLNSMLLLDLFQFHRDPVFFLFNDLLFFTFLAVRPITVFQIWKGTLHHMKTPEFYALDWPVLIFWVGCGAVLDILNVQWTIEMANGEITFIRLHLKPCLLDFFKRRLKPKKAE